MIAPAELRLSHFNTLAVQYQDDVYTLAYYLLGDEDRASEATQSAFLQVFRRVGVRPDQFRLSALRWVFLQAQQQRRAWQNWITSTQDPLLRQLTSLKEDESSALILVDMLGLNYVEAAQVMGCSRKQVGKLLTHARIVLSKQSDKIH